MRFLIKKIFKGEITPKYEIKSQLFSVFHEFFIHRTNSSAIDPSYRTNKSLADLFFTLSFD